MRLAVIGYSEAGDGLDVNMCLTPDTRHHGKWLASINSSAKPRFPVLSLVSLQPMPIDGLHYSPLLLLQRRMLDMS